MIESKHTRTRQRCITGSVVVVTTNRSQKKNKTILLKTFEQCAMCVSVRLWVYVVDCMFMAKLRTKEIFHKKWFRAVVSATSSPVANHFYPKTTWKAYSARFIHSLEQTLIIMIVRFFLFSLFLFLTHTHTHTCARALAETRNESVHKKSKPLLNNLFSEAHRRSFIYLFYAFNVMTSSRLHGCHMYEQNCCIFLLV